MKALLLILMTISLTPQKLTPPFIIGKSKPLIEKNQCANCSNKFRIVNIDSVEAVYIIYAERNDSIFKIVSQKEKLNGCKPLFKGEFYGLKIKSLLENASNKLHIGGMKYGGVMIKLEGDKVLWDLFVSENLKGLCFTGP